MLKEIKAKIDIDLGIDPELYDYIFDTVATTLELRESRSKLILYVENEFDVAYIQSDIERLMEAAKKLAKENTNE